MRIGQRFVPLALFGVLACGGTEAAAAVGLTITDASPPPNSTSVGPGGTFTVAVNVTVTGNEEPTGLDYLFRASSASPDFRITSRSFAGSFFPDPTTPDLNLANGNRLDPDTTNLGSGRTAGSPALGNGTFLVATYTLTVGAGAMPGNYSIVTAALNPGTGYSIAGPPFDRELDSQGSYLVMVVPEPAGLGLAGLAAVGMLARRRTRAAW